MTNQNSKNDLTQHKQSQSIQLQLFELDLSLDDYSNSIEFYDIMPKYHLGGVKRKKDDMVEALPIISRVFYHRKKQHKLDILPAAILDKKSGKTIYYYPSQREELVEDALRKIATKKNRTRQTEDKIGVVFTYYEVHQELIKNGHGYGIAEIKLAIEIMSKAGLVVTDDKQISITSNFFTTVGKEEEELGGRERVLVMFHPLVSKAVNSGNYRLFNYDKLMRMKMPLARWLHRRISHMFSQATINNPYEILLSTIVQDSGMKSYSTISERIRQVEKAFGEMKKAKIISHFKSDVEPYKQKNKILDVLYSLYMTEEFVSDAKKANKLSNLRLGFEDKEEFDIEVLRKELEKPIYKLSELYINNFLSKIYTYEEYKKALDALAVVDHNKARGDRINNIAAYVRKALKEGWVMPEEVSDKSEKDNKEAGEKIIQKKEEEQESQKALQDDPAWIKIRNRIKNDFGDGLWERLLSKISLFSFSDREIVLNAPDKFTRDWIKREYVDKSIIINGKEICLKSVIKKVNPNIERVLIIHV